MACIDPTTRSPGSLFIAYEEINSTEIHTISWHFLVGIDIGILGPIRTEANAIAALLIPCVPSNLNFLDWGIRTPTGHVSHQEPLTSGGAGTHTPSASMSAYRSATLAFVGRGAAGPSGCSGRSISRLFISNAVFIRPGSKNVDMSGDAAYVALVVYLNGSTFVPADFYGQKATLSNITPCQFNASTQRRYGA